MSVTASLDHLIGQRAADVLTTGDACDWTIQLENGMIISNKNEEMEEAPEDVKGKVLCFVSYSELETRLQFGITTPDGVVEETWVLLSPTEYTIGGIEGQTEEYYPQAAPTLVDSLPDDPSGDRVADGPDAEHVQPHHPGRGGKKPKE